MPNLSFQEARIIQSVRQIAEGLHESIPNELGENPQNGIINLDPNDRQGGVLINEPTSMTAMEMSTLRLAADSETRPQLPAPSIMNQKRMRNEVKNSSTV